MRKIVFATIPVLVLGFLVAAGDVFDTQSSGTVSLPKTGQTTSFYAGDDGDLEKGVTWPEPRFTPNTEDGTVTDNLTGLIWYGGEILGSQGYTPDWSHALDYVSIANGNKFQGHSDWRLPNKNELASLIHYENGYAPILVLQFVNSSYVWTSTTCPWDTTKAWAIYRDGEMVPTVKIPGTQDPHPSVHLVRGTTSGPAGIPRTGQNESYGTGDDGALEAGVLWPSSRFTDNSNGTVTDNLTGLVWLKSGDWVESTWLGALQHANNLCDGKLGLTDGSKVGDWRIPNVREMESVIHSGESDTAAWLDTQGFDDISKYKIWWTSTSYVYSSEKWIVYLSSGGAHPTYSYYAYFFPVRDPFPLQQHTITASAGSHGSISPSGEVKVNHGASQTFNFTPDAGYHVADVLVDGSSVGTPASYAFENVIGGHTISVSFAINTYIITPSTGAHGNISPSGAVTVNHGGSQTFNFTPDTGYHVADVMVDGTSVGASAYYTFSNVTADHTISVSFAINTYLIVPSAGPNGSISPSGAVTVNYGGSQAFNFNADAGFRVADVLVDGTSVGTPPSYTFSNVTANHTINVTFVQIVVEVRATVDIDPNTLNLKSKGEWITCYIELPTGYNVNNIDILTVKISAINGTPVEIFAESRPVTVGDYDSDGAADLMVKFSRSKLISFLSSGNSTLTVKGKLTSGEDFKGADTIRVIK